MQMKTERTWILIADGHQAKVFERHGPNATLVPVEDMFVEMELPPNRDIQDDRPGRSFESSNPSRHSIASRTDPHRDLKRDLARNVADKLSQGLSDRRFDHLVVVAPPATLGDLRQVFSAPLQAKVTAELAKDLTKVPHHDLPSHLKAI
jgi:protein required for attachment to host cells